MTSVHFDVGKGSQLASQPKIGTCNYEPFCGIPLVPFDSVTIVHRELMVKVMVSFPKSDQRCKEMVPRREFVVERLGSEPMSEGVDAEHALDSMR